MTVTGDNAGAVKLIGNCTDCPRGTAVFAGTEMGVGASTLTLAAASGTFGGKLA